MVTFGSVLLIFSPVILAIAVAIGYAIRQKKERADEALYLDGLSNEEKRRYYQNINDAKVNEQKTYAINGVVMNRQNR